MEEVQPKFFVKVYGKEEAIKVPKEILDSLKGVARGKMMARMKKEAIYCPVLERERAFLICFACPNFISRIRGEVHCAGLPLKGPHPDA